MPNRKVKCKESDTGYHYPVQPIVFRRHLISKQRPGSGTHSKVTKETHFPHKFEQGLPHSLRWPYTTMVRRPEAAVMRGGATQRHARQSWVWKTELPSGSGRCRKRAVRLKADTVLTATRLWNDHVEVFGPHCTFNLWTVWITALSTCKYCKKN